MKKGDFLGTAMNFSRKFPSIPDGNMSSSSSIPGLSLIHIYRAGRGRYGIVVGPEGGMTREEAHSLREAGGGIVTLGPRILRTETAGMAVLSAMLCVYGEME